MIDESNLFIFPQFLCLSKLSYFAYGSNELLILKQTNGCHVVGYGYLDIQNYI